MRFLSIISNVDMQTKQAEDNNRPAEQARGQTLLLFTGMQTFKLSNCWLSTDLLDISVNAVAAATFPNSLRPTAQTSIHEVNKGNAVGYVTYTICKIPNDGPARARLPLPRFLQDEAVSF